MSTETIGQFFGQLGFKVDWTGLNQFERRMRQLSSEVNKIGRKLERSLNLKPTLGNYAAQLRSLQGLTAKMNKEQMQTAKFTLATEQARAKVAQAQAKAQNEVDKGKRAAQAFSLRAEQQMMRNQSAKTQAMYQQTRLQRAMHQTELASMRLQDRIQARLNPQPRRNASTGGTGSYRVSRGHASPSLTRHAMAGGVGGMVGAHAGGFSMPGIGGFTSAVGAAAAGVVGLGVAAIGAAAAMHAFVNSIAEKGQQSNMRIAQLTAGYDDGKRSKQDATKLGRQANYRFLGVADELGLDAGQSGKDYAANRTNLMDAGMSDVRAEKTLHGFLAYAKGSGLDTQNVAGIMKAMGQSLSKGQLMSEEWKNQIAEHLPGAGKIGGEAYQKMTGGKLTGAAATAALTQAMAKGAIKGDDVKKFFETVAELLERDANRGGRLDLAKTSLESQKNRRNTLIQQVATNAYDKDDGAMGKALTANAVAQQNFIAALAPLVDKMSTVGTASIQSMTRLTDSVTQLIPAIDSWLNGFSGNTDKLEQAIKSNIDGLKAFTDGFQSTFASIGISQWGEKFGALGDALVRLNNALEPLKALIGVLAGTFATLAGMALDTALETLTGAVNALAAVLEWSAKKLGYESQAEKTNRLYNEAHPNRVVDGSGTKPLVMAPQASDSIIGSQMAMSPLVGGLLKLNENQAIDRLQASQSGAYVMASNQSQAAVNNQSTVNQQAPVTTINNDIKTGDMNVTIHSNATTTEGVLKDALPAIQQAAREAAKQGVLEAQGKQFSPAAVTDLR